MLPVGTDGRIALYNGSPGSTHIVADVAGYFASGTPGAAGFGSVAPARVLDTRTALGAPNAPVPAGGTVTPRVLGTGGVPSSGVAAVVVNLTVTEAEQSGYVTGYPSGAGRPLASSVNFDAGRTAANLAVLPVGGDGRIALYNGSPGAAEFVADVSGYFMSGTPTVGGFGAVVPTRVLDTRLGQGASRAMVSGGSTLAVKVTGTAGVPSSGVASVVVNLTVTEPWATGYITGYANGSQRPPTSNVNFEAKQTTSTLAVLPVGTDGRIALYNGAPGATQLVADIAGYSLGDAVAPPVSAPSTCPVGQRNVPGGPDPWGGCFPGPGNAGVPAGTALTAYSGSLRITTPNTVIDAKSITGRLVIATSGVTITRSRISNGIENAGGSRFTVTDSLILGATTDDKALDTDHFTAERNEIKGGNSGGWCNDCVLRNNWIHNDIRLASNDSHHLSALPDGPERAVPPQHPRVRVGADVGRWRLLRKPHGLRRLPDRPEQPRRQQPVRRAARTLVLHVRRELGRQAVLQRQQGQIAATTSSSEGPTASAGRTAPIGDFAPNAAGQHAGATTSGTTGAAPDQ